MLFVSLLCRLSLHLKDKKVLVLLPIWRHSLLIAHHWSYLVYVVCMPDRCQVLPTQRHAPAATKTQMRVLWEGGLKSPQCNPPNDNPGHYNFMLFEKTVGNKWKNWQANDICVCSPSCQPMVTRTAKMLNKAFTPGIFSWEPALWSLRSQGWVQWWWWWK